MNYEQEVREAIVAGERSLHSLRAADRYLSSASGWGVIDILGGGLFTGLIKHSKLNNARSCMETARRDIQRFRKELDDVDDFIPGLNVGDFMTMADFFFDGLVADILVQSKIAEARKQVKQAIYQVESIVNRLKYTGNPRFV